MLPQTAKQILSHFRQEPVTKDLQQFVRKNAFDNNYLFIRKKGDTAVYCSFCQKEVALQNCQSIKHNTETACPRCRKKVVVKHVWRGIKSLADVAYVYHFARSIKDKKMITCQTFYVFRFEGDDPCALKYSPSCYYVFSEKGGKMMYVEPYDRQYIAAKSVYVKNPIGDFYHGWRGKILVNAKSFSRAIRQTAFKYSAWEKYTDLNEYILLYLALFAKYPQLEYLSKCGLSTFIKSYLGKNRDTFRLLNWRGKTMRKVLGFQPTKQELSYANKLPGEKLASWIALRKSGCPVLLPDLDAYGWLDKMQVLSEINKTVPLDKLLLYQKRLEVRGELSPYFIRDYRDYLEECKELNLDMSRKETLYPNNLPEKHLQNQKLISHKRNPQLNIKIRERYPKLAQQYEYESKSFRTVVPKDSGDFIVEGGRLDHCVARYADRYANGVTDIVFLRKAAEPDTPYYTMEIHNGRILQCRGMKNSAPEGEIKAFLDEFSKYCSKKKSKKHAV